MGVSGKPRDILHETNNKVEINKDTFQSWTQHNENKSLNIFIAGQVFGGKPGEAPQKPKDFKIIDDTLLITFHGTERLWIKKPHNIKIDDNSLTINNAEVIRWGWHYYGKPQTDLNWCEELYLIGNDKIIKTEIMPLDGNLKSEFKTFKRRLETPILRISDY